MSAHTPGPWTFDWSVSMHDRPDLPCVIDADRLVVAQCWDDGHSEAACEANARLISAAPDLAEALLAAHHAIVSLNEDEFGPIIDGHGEHRGWVRDELLSKIRAALSKAGGTSA